MKTKKDIHYSEIFCLTFSKNEKRVLRKYCWKKLKQQQRFFQNSKAFSFRQGIV